MTKPLQVSSGADAPSAEVQGQSPVLPHSRHGSAAAKALASTVLSAFSWYAGINMVIPALAGLLMALVASKLFVIRDRGYIPALAAFFGHFAWILAGAVLLGSSECFPDLLVMGILIVWLWVRPGAWSGGAVAVFSGFAMADAIVNLSAHTMGDATHKALVAHIGLRLFVMASLVEVYWRYRKSPTDEGTVADASRSRSA